jgi:hypothetical protein
MFLSTSGTQLAGPSRSCGRRPVLRGSELAAKPACTLSLTVEMGLFGDRTRCGLGQILANLMGEERQMFASCPRKFLGDFPDRACWGPDSIWPCYSPESGTRELRRIGWLMPSFSRISRDLRTNSPIALGSKRYINGETLTHLFGGFSTEGR